MQHATGVCSMQQVCVQLVAIITTYKMLTRQNVCDCMCTVYNTYAVINLFTAFCCTQVANNINEYSTA